MSKYTNGAFVFFRNSDVDPQDVGHLKQLAEKHNVDDSIIPQYAGDRESACRAIRSLSFWFLKQGLRTWQLKKRDRSYISYGVIAENKDNDEEKFNPEHESKLVWEEKNPIQFTSDNNHHEVLNHINQTLNQFLGKIVCSDFTKTIADYLLKECNAIPFRDDGRVYWCPEGSIQKLNNLEAFLKEVHISLVVCEVETKVKEVVREAANESLADKLASLKVEVESFDGTENPSTYMSRLNQYQELRGKALTYKAALGCGTGIVEEVLQKLEESVKKLLDIRQTTIIKHRS